MVGRKNTELKKLIRYLAGECSDAEAAEVSARIAADERFADLADELRTVWEAASRRPRGMDVDAAWEEIEPMLRETTRVRQMPRVGAAAAPDWTGPVQHFADVRAPQARARRGGRYALRVMAIAAIAVVAVLVIFNIGDVAIAPSGAPTVKEFVTKAGERGTIRLSDGTSVRLNVGSRLSVPAQFEADRRWVELEGEAFFEVERDAARPFFVRAGDTEVQVLGTSFNVDAYADQPDVDVVVAEGIVSVVHGAAAPEGVLLHAHDHVRLADGRAHVRRDIDVRPFTAWTEGRLVFARAPIEVVARQLELWYDLDVELAVVPDSLTTLDAEFTDEPVDEILQVVAATLRIDYTREGDQVVFRPLSSRPAL